MCKIKTIDIDGRQIKVADIKEKYIGNIIEAARECDIIDRIVLFGSSINEYCKESSDIDIAVFGNQSPSRALSSKKHERFAKRLFSFNNQAQAYDIVYSRMDLLIKVIY